MSERYRLLESMKKYHADKLGSISFDNKEFEKEVIVLFSHYFKKEEEIEENYIKNYSNENCGLDGGTASEIRALTKECFQHFDELKKKYGIE